MRGKRLARLGIGAVYHFLIAKPRDVLTKVLGRPRGRLVVLCYHGVRPEDRSAFAWQMDTLLRAARPTALDSCKGAPGNGNLVAVTFDDGLASVGRNALPELETRGIPATIFVPTGNLGAPPTWSMDRDDPCREDRILEAQELRLLSTRIVTVGSHSVSHGDLASMTEERVLWELSRSKEDLEGILGTSVDLFAFPYGRYSPRAVDLARRAGYRNACTIEPETVRLDEDPFLVGRFRVDPSDWKIEFWLKLRGAYEGVAPFQRLKRRFSSRWREGRGADLPATR